MEEGKKYTVRLGCYSDAQVEQLRIRVVEILKLRDGALIKLAKEIGVSPWTLSKFITSLHGDTRLSTLIKIEKFLDQYNQG